MIIRYSTPYHNFVLPFLVDEIEVIELIYSQNGVNLLNKKSTQSGSGISIESLEDYFDNASMGEDYFIQDLANKVENLENSSLLRVHLTQEETALFTFHKAARKNIALIEIRVKDKESNVFVSFPIQVRIFGGTQEGVL